MLSFVRTLFSAFSICCVLAIVLIGSTALSFLQEVSKTLPPVESLQEQIPSFATTILDKNNNVIGSFAEKTYKPISIDAIPSLVQQAFISAEDRDFWHHQGIDPIAIVRAGIFDIRHHGEKRMIGASTITQQVVKNMLTGDDRNFKRKIDEAILALRMEKQYSKKKILELYLNNIYLGYGAYGISSASQTYFQKDVKDLTLSEIAYLAILPKGPSNYDPVRHKERAIERRNYVLQRMYEDGAITSSQMHDAMFDALPTPHRIDNSGVAKGYYAEEVRRELITHLGSNSVYNGGIVVHTSMDPVAQTLAENVLQRSLIVYDKRHGWRGVKQHIDINRDMSLEEIVSSIDMPHISNYPLAVVIGFNDGLEVLTQDKNKITVKSASLRWILGGRRTSSVFHVGDVVYIHRDENGEYDLIQIPEVQGALVAMDVHTGQIVAISGGFSSDLSSFNRATQSWRQIGSTFKPFIFLTGFEHGYDPISPVLDLPITINPGNGSPLWTPGADGGHGWGIITAQKALENSRNLASVRLLYDIGLDEVEKTAQAFGIYDHIQNYSAALGAQETTDIRLTTAYAMLANGGNRVYPTFINDVTDHLGHVIVKRPDSGNEQIAPPLAVAQLTDVLQGVVKNGTAYPALHTIKLPMAGKTGTSNNNMDAWFVGYTPDIAVGIHIGYDMPKTLGSHEFGGLAAAPAFGDFISEYNKLYPQKSEFPLPPNTHRETFDPISGEKSSKGVPMIVLNHSGDNVSKENNVVEDSEPNDNKEEISD